jgi:hypothetical protein
MSHTPGEWEASINVNDKRTSEVYARNLTVAVCGQGPEAKANACLIATAPRMLAMLEDIATNGMVYAHWKVINEIIAKAKGE